MFASDEGANPAGRRSECNGTPNWDVRTITGRVRIAAAASTSQDERHQKGVASKGEGREVHDLDLRLTAGLRRHGR